MLTKVSGVTFSNEDGTSRRSSIASMSESDKIELERDPYNPYDRNAVKVNVIKNGKSLQIGFLEKELAAMVSPQMRRGTTFNAVCTGCGIWKDRPFCEIDILGL